MAPSNITVADQDKQLHTLLGQCAASFPPGCVEVFLDRPVPVLFHRRRLRRVYHETMIAIELYTKQWGLSSEVRGSLNFSGTVPFDIQEVHIYKPDEGISRRIIIVGTDLAPGNASSLLPLLPEWLEILDTSETDADERDWLKNLNS